MILVLLALTVASCGEDVPLAGSELAPAETPDSVEASALALPLQVVLRAGYWSEGQHRYRFVVDCPELGDPVLSDAIEFRVTQLTPALQGPVYLRLGGLSTGIITPPNVGAIHPAQPTIAVISFLGLSQETVDTATAQCTGTLEFDGGMTEVIVPARPFRP